MTVNVVVDAVAVHQQQNAAIPVSQAPETTDSHVAVEPVGGDVETAHTPQNVSQRPVAIFLDLVRRDDCDGGGRVSGALQVFRGAVNLYVAQLFQAGFPEVLGRFLGDRGQGK